MRDEFYSVPRVTSTELYAMAYSLARRGLICLRRRADGEFHGRAIFERSSETLYEIGNRPDLDEEYIGLWFCGRLSMNIDVDFGDVLRMGGTVMVAVNDNLHTFYEGHETEVSLRGEYLSRRLKYDYPAEVVARSVVCGHVPLRGVQGG